MKTEDELKEIAIGIHAGTIFTDRHIKDTNMLTSVFMPIIFGAFKEAKDIENVGLIYEHLSEAGPRSVNGYPSFMSMNILDHAEAKRVFEMYDKLKEIKL